MRVAVEEPVDQQLLDRRSQDRRREGGGIDAVRADGGDVRDLHPAHVLHGHDP